VVNGKIMELIEINRPADKPYIVLESISMEQMVSKGVIVIY